MGDIELAVFQNLAKIGLITIYYPMFYSFIMAVQTDVLCLQGHSSAAELREDRLPKMSVVRLCAQMKAVPCRHVTEWTSTSVLL